MTFESNLKIAPPRTVMKGSAFYWKSDTIEKKLYWEKIILKNFLTWSSSRYPLFKKLPSFFFQNCIYIDWVSFELTRKVYNIELKFISSSATELK